MQDKVLFTPIPIEKYNEAFKDNQIKRLKRQAQRLGCQIIEG